MRRVFFFLAVLICAGTLLGAVGPGAASAGKRAAAQGPQAGAAHVVAGYGRLPLSFEPNQGQTAAQVDFLARGQGHTLFLTRSEAVLVLQTRTARLSRPALVGFEAEDSEPAGRHLRLRGHPGREAGTAAGRASVLRMKLVGANPNARPVGVDPLPGKSNYFIGNDPKKWRTNVPHYARVKYEGVYPGIALLYYGTDDRQLEYDFVVSPGADPAQIQLAFEGADSLALDPQGDLVVSLAPSAAGLPGGELRFRAPRIYQRPDWVGEGLVPSRAAGVVAEIAGGYTVLASNRVAFRLGSYDRTQPLILDPVLVYSTYLGGSDVEFSFSKIVVDSDGNAYVAGTTSSADFPIAGGFDSSYAGPIGSRFGDGFVAKFSPTGTLLYSTYLGGSDEEEALDLAVDAAGSAYVTGDTSSTDFPTMNPLQATCAVDISGFCWDVIVTKLSPSGAALVYSTYLGGSGGFESGFGIAVDASGNAYVTGFTGSSDFPTVNAIQTTQGDGFVSKLSSGGTSLAYSSFLEEFGAAVAVDGSGAAYVAGDTASADFPTVNAFQSLPASGGIFKTINSGGSWSSVAPGLVGRIVRPIVFDPVTPTTIYAGTIGSGVFKSTNGGTSWTPMNTGLGNLDVEALAIDPSNPNVLYAGTFGGGVFKSVDGASNWSAANTGLSGLALDIQSLVVDPANTSILYAGCFFGAGVFKSVDAGSNWSAASTGLGRVSSRSVQGLAIDSSTPTTIYAATRAGVFKSIDAAANWVASNTGMTFPNTEPIVVDPLSPNVVYVGDHNSGVFRSADGGGNWSPLNTGLSALDIRALAIDPSDPNVLYAGTFGAGVFRTADSGLNWSAVDQGVDRDILGLAIDPTTPSTVYAGAAFSAGALAKLAPDGSAFVYSTFLDGNGADGLRGVMLDSANNTYITGVSGSTDFPTSLGAFQPTCNSCGSGRYDAVVLKMGPTGSSLVYSTYFGGTDDDVGEDIVVDAFGNAYVAGETRSADLILQNPLQASCALDISGFCDDAFVAALGPTGSPLLFSTYFGGTDTDAPDGIAVDQLGNIWVAGFTASPDLATVNPLSSFLRGTSDRFVAKIAEPVPLDFSLARTPSSRTVTAGQSTTYTATLTPLNAPFGRPIELSVSGLPERTSFIFSPNPATPGSSVLNLPLTINTQAPVGLGARLTPPDAGSNPSPIYALWWALLPLAVLAVGLKGRTRRRLRTCLLLGLLLVGVIGQGGCMLADLLNPPRPGTPPGTYTITIVATSGVLQRGVTATLVVQ